MKVYPNIKPNFYALPSEKGKFGIFYHEGNSFIMHKDYQVSKNSVYSSDNLNTTAIVDNKKKTLYIESLTDKTSESISIPFEIKALSLLVHKNNVFIGGDNTTELLLQYNMLKKEWFKLSIPKELMKYGKSIDDILVDEQQLIAVDDIVLPKYILFYNIDDSGSKYIEHLKLVANGSYEHIRKAQISENYIGLFSTTVGRSGAYNHITLYERNNKNSFCGITLTLENDDNNAFLRSGCNIELNDFLLHKNKLIFVFNKNNLCTMRIYKKNFESIKPKRSIVNYNYFKPDADNTTGFNENIVKLTSMGASNKVILTLETKETKYIHKIIEI